MIFPCSGGHGWGHLWAEIFNHLYRERKEISWSCLDQEHLWRRVFLLPQKVWPKPPVQFVPATVNQELSAVLPIGHLSPHACPCPKLEYRSVQKPQTFCMTLCEFGGNFGYLYRPRIRRMGSSGYQLWEGHGRQWMRPDKATPLTVVMTFLVFKILSHFIWSPQESLKLSKVRKQLLPSLHSLLSSPPLPIN